MPEFCKLIEDKLAEYNYEIYNVSQTSNEYEYCIMSESMMIFTNEGDQSITISFQCNLMPENVAERMMVLNEVQELKAVYVTESYYFDEGTKKYILGKEARKLITEKILHETLREITQEQVYSHILATQKCHEC